MLFNQKSYHSIAFGIVLFYLIYWFYQGHFLFQLHRPTLINTGIDNTYWLFCILRIPQTIMRFPIIFDALLVLFTIYALCTCTKVMEESSSNTCLIVERDLYIFLSV